MTTVMIIDDDPAIRKLLALVLCRNGFDVVTADSGRTALQKLQNSSVQLVITDIFMPELDGIEFICEANKIRPDLKIIAISGGSASISPEFYLSVAKNVGAVTILEKPVQSSTLIQTISDLMEAELVCAKKKGPITCRH